MYRIYINFIRGLSANRVSLFGVVFTTSSFICFIFFEILRLIVVLTNAYIGLITYLLFPSLFVLGLVLIPIGLSRYKKKRGMTVKELLNERFDPEQVKASQVGSKMFITVLFFTVVNIVFISAAGFREK